MSSNKTYLNLAVHCPHSTSALHYGRTNLLTVNDVPVLFQ